MVVDKLGPGASAEDLEDLKYFERDVYGLLVQQSALKAYEAIKSCDGQGLEAWRRLMYAINPKCVGGAEAIRRQLVAERPSVGEEYELVSVKPLTDELRLMATRAVLTPELALKVDGN